LWISVLSSTGDSFIRRITLALLIRR
jgi:hypothetical protein